VRPEQVAVSFKAADSLPFDPGTGGSKQSNPSGHAVYQAAREVREKLINLAARELGCKAEEIKQDGNKLTGPNKGSTTTEKMIERAVKENGGPPFHLAMFEHKDIPPATPFTVQAAEAEVDPATGAVKVLNVVTEHGTGVVPNRFTVTGQIDGGVDAGLGSAGMEEKPMVDGKIVTRKLGEAKLPGIGDLPPL